MDMISLCMNYCKLHFLFIFAHVDLEILLIDWLIEGNLEYRNQRVKV